MGGDLHLTGPGVALHLTGEGDATRVMVSGRLPRERGVAASLARPLADAGVVIEVTDRAGRVLARAGAVRPSLAGRLLAGPSAIRPTGRGVVVALRGRTAAAPD